jgi:hypothetical protein
VKKRIVIGLIAVLIGVAAYELLQPRKGSVEWHKREFRNARQEMFGQAWYTPFERLYCDVVSKPHKLRTPTSREVESLKERQLAAQTALVKAGYLVERSFKVSNRDANSMMEDLVKSARGVIPQENFYFNRIVLVQSNLIVLAAVPDDLPKWEELIRNADVPEIK